MSTQAPSTPSTVHDDAWLLAQRGGVVELGRAAFARARAAHGRAIKILASERFVERNLDTEATPWPQPTREPAQPTEMWICDVSPTRVEYWLAGLSEWATNLDPAAAPILAPYSSSRSGTLNLWLVAAARMRLPPRVRIAIRHDLAGPRIAQLALHFGADILAGPVHESRKLPLAGVTRPDEASWQGLRTLIEQTGLVPEGRN